MKTQTTRRRSGRKQSPRKVRIEFQAKHAQEVCIAGDFNDWRPKATPMLNVGSGRWLKDLALPPGRYEYRFVTDGEWKCDPAAPKQVSNPFGTFNSILEVSSESENNQSP